MLFDILSSIADAAKEKVMETKDDYEKYYREFSEKTRYWDDDKMKREYEKLASGSDYARKAAMLKLMQERGLLKS